MSPENVSAFVPETRPNSDTEQSLINLAQQQYGVDLEPCEVRALIGMLLHIDPPDDDDSGLRFDIVTAPNRSEVKSPNFTERHGMLHSVLASARETFESSAT